MTPLNRFTGGSPGVTWLMLAALACLGTFPSRSIGSSRVSLTVSYTVEIRDPASQSFHVVATFRDPGQPTLDVALPTWTPGVYEAKDYYKNLSNFHVHDPAGNTIPSTSLRPSVWRIETGGRGTIIVEFDYAAKDLAWNGAGITSTHAVFTGTQLFLEPLGHRDAPSTVRFVLPPPWRVASALRETADPMVFTAPNYDELVDAPAVLGSFQIDRFEAEGKPHFIVRAPADSAYPDLPELIASARKIIAAGRSIFGSLPYDKYVFFGVADLDGGAVEHGNSYLAPGMIRTNAAHEFFHLWNVKRIRPAEMWPYDYQQVAPEVQLWVSEGITSYYQSLISYRAGFEAFADVPRDGLVPGVRPTGSLESELLIEFAYRMALLARTPDHYYSMGQLRGAMLDILILRDTRGVRRLDDVMRELHAQYHLKGRGFTPEDFLQTVNGIGGRDYRSFFERYIWGSEAAPYDSVFQLAGYRVNSANRTVGAVRGMRSLSTTPDGHGVGTIVPESQAARIGLQVGDIITMVDGIPIHEVALSGLFGNHWIGGRFVEKAGRRVVLGVQRAGTTLELPVTLARIQETLFRIDPDPGASPEALATRREWLKR